MIRHSANLISTPKTNTSTSKSGNVFVSMPSTKNISNKRLSFSYNNLTKSPSNQNNASAEASNPTQATSSSSAKDSKVNSKSPSSSQKSEPAKPSQEEEPQDKEEDTPPPPERKHLWIDEVVNYSSQLDNSRWKADCLIGPPTIYPKYGHIDGAWAQGKCDGDQCVVVKFEEAIFIKKVNIYETFNGGAVKAICLWNLDEEQWTPIWELSNDKKLITFSVARIFSPILHKIPQFKGDTMMIEMDCSIASNFCEIDAIEIEGYDELIVEDAMKLDEIRTDYIVATEKPSKSRAQMMKQSEKLMKTIQDDNDINQPQILLRLAVMEGNIRAVRWALQYGADPNYANEYGNTLMHQAAMKGDSDIFMVLLDHGGQIEEDNHAKWKPIHTAAAYRRVDILNLLMQHHVELNCVNNVGNTPLHISCTVGSNKCSGLLIKQGARLDILNNKHCKPIDYAFQTCHVELIKLLVTIDDIYELVKQENIKLLEEMSTNGVDISITGTNKETVLHRAVSNKDLKAVKILLNYNADPNAEDEHGLTPLFYAVKQGLSDIVKELYKCKSNLFHVDAEGNNVTYYCAQRNDLELLMWFHDRNVDIHRKDKNGRTISYHAAKNGRMDILKWLKQRNVDIYWNDSNGLNIAFTAAESGHFEILQWLRENDVDINKTTISGVNLCHIAATNGHYDMLKWLIDQKVDIKCMNEYGRTPLQAARENHHDSCVELLLKNDADVLEMENTTMADIYKAAKERNIEFLERVAKEGKLGLPNASGQDETALHTAFSDNYAQGVKLLLDSGAEINLKDKNGDNPIHYAAKNGQVEVLKAYCDIIEDAKTPDVFYNDNNQGNSPLHIAALQGQDRCTQQLLRYIEGDKGQSRFDWIINKNGKTAIEAALQMNNDITAMSIKNALEDQMKNVIRRENYISGGKVIFQEHRGSKYIRMASTVSVDEVYKQLRWYWYLPHPELMITIIGGVDGFNVNPELKKIFGFGLAKIIRLIDPYVFTVDCDNVGIMKYVGEAVSESSAAAEMHKNSEMMLIGYSYWKANDTNGNNDSGVNQESHSENRYPVNRTHNEIEVPLHKSFKHLIFLDEFRKYGLEPCALMSGKMLYDHKTACLNIIVGGGYNSIRKLHSYIAVTDQYSKNKHRLNIPLIIVADSGGAANILAYACSHTTTTGTVKDHRGKEVNNYRISPQHENEVKRLIRKEFKWSEYHNFKEILQCFQKINEIMKYRDIFSTYSTSEGDFDTAIVQSLMKDGLDPITERQQIEIASKCNKLYLAKVQIMSGLNDQSLNFTDLKSALIIALIDDRLDFVMEIFGGKLTPREIFTKSVLRELYDFTAKNDVVLKTVFSVESGRWFSSGASEEKVKLFDAGKVISKLMGYGFENPFKKYRKDKDGTSPLLRQETLGELNLDTTAMLDHPIHHYFIWTILARRYKVAYFLLQKVVHPMAASLIAYTLLRRLAKQAKRAAATELSHQFSTEAKLYQEHAVNLLRQYYDDDESNAMVVLRLKMLEWGDTTCMQVAHSSGNEKFLSQRCCQLLLSKLWIDENTMPSQLVATREQEEDKPDANKDAQLKAKRRTLFHRQSAYDLELGSELSEHVAFVNESNENDDPTVKHGCFAGNQCSYLTAPRSIFIYNVFAYLVFIVLFSYVIMSDFRLYPSIAEGILAGWVTTYTLEEVRQLIMLNQTSFKGKLKSYFTSIANIGDTLSSTLFFLGLVLRFFEATIEAGRLIYCISFLVFCFRVLSIFSVSRHLGPFLVMINKMIKDLFKFLLLLAVFVIAYGVACQAILYPNTAWNWDLLKQIFYIPFFQLFGELFINETRGKPCFPNATYVDYVPGSGCVANQWMIPLLLTGYMLITNVLLLNLLIAVFNNTYSKIQENSDTVWKFQRYALIEEYLDKPTLPPPLVIVPLTLNVFRYFFINQMCCIPRPRSNKLKIHPLDINHKRLLTWEGWLAFLYWRKHEETKQAFVKSFGKKSTTI